MKNLFNRCLVFLTVFFSISCADDNSRIKIEDRTKGESNPLRIGATSLSFKTGSCLNLKKFFTELYKMEEGGLTVQVHTADMNLLSEVNTKNQTTKSIEDEELLISALHKNKFKYSVDFTNESLMSQNILIPFKQDQCNIITFRFDKETGEQRPFVTEDEISGVLDPDTPSEGDEAKVTPENETGEGEKTWVEETEKFIFHHYRIEKSHSGMVYMSNPDLNQVLVYTRDRGARIFVEEIKPVTVDLCGREPVQSLQFEKKIVEWAIDEFSTELEVTNRWAQQAKSVLKILPLEIENIDRNDLPENLLKISLQTYLLVFDNLRSAAPLQCSEEPIQE